MKSIPHVVYPLDIDSDYTLFRTYNSSQSVLARDLDISAEVIEINPKTANEADVWPENGFITIEKELIYYDSVIRNSSNKVVQFKDCIRGVEGKADNYQVGTSVYSNVTAQIHNQLVDAILAIEDTIGDISDMLKIGMELKSQQGLRKNLLAKSKHTLVADVDHSFTASLHTSLTNMLAATPMANDACPDVEFEWNDLGGGMAEYCVRIYGDYNSFQIDFGDGTSTTTQLSGVHSGGSNPTVTVQSDICTVVQSPNPMTDTCSMATLPDPSIPFVIQIPLVPDFPNFIPPNMVAPGPLFNLPPINLQGFNLCPSQTSVSCPSIACPSVIISVIEACKTPQIIKIVSPCRISLVSLIGCNIPSVISLVGCCPPSVISVIAPSFDCISFCTVPSFACISFCPVPSFNCISFCDPPSFAPISFAPFPSVNAISFDVLVNLSVAPICFCPPPSFACISFCNTPSFSTISFAQVPSFTCISFCPPPDLTVSFAPPNFSAITVNFGEVPSFTCISFCPPPTFAPISFASPPNISVIWGTPPTVSCVVSIKCPCSSTPVTQTMGMTAPLDMTANYEEETIPINFDDIGIPREINLIVPKIPDVKLIHDIPKEITVKSYIPKEIQVKSDIPTTINIVSDIPKSIFVEPAPNFPKSIFVEPAPNFPSTLKLEVTGMPDKLQVTGIPKTIEVIGMPATVQLLMPENPEIQLKWDAVDMYLKPHPDLEKFFSNIMIQPR